MEKKEITGLSIDENISKVTISEIDDYYLFIESFYKVMSHNNLKFSMLSFQENKISFVLNDTDLRDLQFSLSKILKQVNFNIEVNERLACLTLVGLGFTSCPVLSIKVLSLLAVAKIKINQTVASNLSFSLLIDKKDVSEALNLIAKKFEI